MKTKNKILLKKIVSITVSLFLFNSVILNNFAYAVPIQQFMPIAQSNNILQTKIDSSVGYVTDFFNSPSNKNTIFFIQDLHTNPSVQKNISKILEQLDKQYVIDRIYLEGLPTGKANMSVLNTLKGYDISDELLNKNIISGTEYYFFNNNTDAQIYGLEDWNKYLSNIKRAAKILQDQDYILQTYNDFKEELYSNIRNIKKIEEYINFNLADEKILSMTNQPILKYNELHKYISLSDNINNLNSKKITEEHNLFINDLKNDLSVSTYKEIVSLSKKENLKDYYYILYQHLTSNDKYTLKYPNLKKLLQYTLQKSQLNIINLISQQNKYFNDYLSSITNDKMQQDMFVVKMTQIFQKFITLSISDEDYNFFAENYQKYINLLPIYLSQNYGKYTDLLFYDIIFDYHKVNKDRNIDFIKNISSYLNNKKDSNKVTVVIAGGFHSSILETLKKENFSYILLTPNIENSYNNDFYNEIILSTLVDTIKTNALAPIRQLLLKANLVSPETVEQFYKALLNELITKLTKNQSPYISPEELRTIMIEKKEITGVPITIDISDPNLFIVNILGNKVIYQVVDNKVIWQTVSTKYKKKKIEDLKLKVVAKAKRKFNIFEATSLQLNPNSSYSSRFISRREGTKRNFMFTLSMILSYLKKTDWAYDLMMGFASLNKNKTTKITIDFDADFSDKIKKLKNFSNFKGKTLNIIIENGLNEYLSREDILNIVAEAISRLDTPSINFKDGLFIGYLDRSTNLFEDHLNNGFIGVNSGIFQIPDEDVKKAILHAGIIHELTHEFKGSLNSSEYNIFEERMMFCDMKFLIEYMAKIEYGQDIDFGSLLYSDEESNLGRYEHIINRITSALTAEITEPKTGKKASLFTENVRFIRKFQNYKYNIEDISKFIKRKNFSVIGRRGQLQHIENDYLQGDSDAQEKLFSNLIVTEQKEISMEDFLRKHISEKRITEVDKSIKELIKKFEEAIYSSDLAPEIKEQKVKEFARYIYEVLHLMYEKMPDYLFGVYFNEQGVIADHALNHSIELLNNAILILKKQISKINEKDAIDLRALVFSAFLHDISCTLTRLDHEQNSATFAKAILQGELPEDEIEKIYRICIGHKKLNFEFDSDGNIIITDMKATEEQSILYSDIYTDLLEARILRDADGLSAALALDRILGVWLTTKQTFLNRDLTIDDRKKLIEENKFLMNDGGDAINDLLRQFLRREKKYYITEEAGSLIESQRVKKKLYDFLDSKETRERIKNAGMGISDKDIDEGLAIMRLVLNDLLPGVEEIPEEDDIKFLGIKQKFKLFKLVLSYLFNKNIQFNQNMAVSDIHGGYTRFAELIINILDPTLDISKKTDKEIDDIIVDRLKSTNSNMLFYLLGDLLDRGDRQVETFELVKRISETGRLRYVIGNHDLYAFMNLLGLHLPFYTGYKGIPEDYIDFQGRDINKLLNKLQSGDKDFLRSFFAEEGETLTINHVLDKKFWAKKLFDYMDQAEKEQAKWEATEKELQDKFHTTFGFELKSNGKDVLNDVSIALNSEGISNDMVAMFLDPEFISFNKKFFGRNVGIAVYTGIRAVNKMSVNWWIERAQEVELLKNKYNQTPALVEYWDAVSKVITEIIAQQKSKYEEEVVDHGNIAWAIIDAIMYRNYESTEWNALDWAYHNNWGGGEKGFIAQRSNKLRDAGQPEINKVNYFDDSIVKDMLEFYKKHFHLYRFDEYGICYMHSMLPVDEHGDISIGYVDDKGVFHDKDKNGKRIKGFIYKGVHYKGKNIFKGLNKISEDIRNYDISSNKLSDIMEALTLLTAIYADNTTRIKPANLKEMKSKFGFHNILRRKGITTIVVGHNPVKKLDEQFEYTTLRFFNKEFKIINVIQIDGNMSPGYEPPKGAGLVRFIGGEINTRGFLRGDSTEITSSVTPDVTKEIFINSILINVFPRLKDILLLTEKIYKSFSRLKQRLSFGNIKINKRNTTVIDIAQSLEDIENIAEIKHIKGIKDIVIAPYQAIDGTFILLNDEPMVITGSLDDIPDVKYEIRVYKIKVARGYIPLITYSYEYSGNTFDAQTIQNKIIEQIIDQINKKHLNIKTTKNMFINNSVNDIFESVSTTESIRKIFGPMLYDTRVKKSFNIAENISEKVNIDKIKDLLSAA